MFGFTPARRSFSLSVKTEVKVRAEFFDSASASMGVTQFANCRQHIALLFARRPLLQFANGKCAAVGASRNRADRGFVVEPRYLVCMLESPWLKIFP